MADLNHGVSVSTDAKLAGACSNSSQPTGTPATPGDKHRARLPRPLRVRQKTLPNGGVGTDAAAITADCDPEKFNWAEFLASFTGMTPDKAYEEYDRRVAKRLSRGRLQYLDPAEVSTKVETKIARKVARGQVRVLPNLSGWGFIEQVLTYAIRELDRSLVRRQRRQAHHLTCCPKPSASPWQRAIWREELGVRASDRVKFRS